MKILNDVYFDREPKKVSVYPTSVYVCSSCELVDLQIERKKQDGQSEFEANKKYKCQMIVYEISEYIDKLQQENEALNAQTTELQLALCEVYEMML